MTATHVIAVWTGIGASLIGIAGGYVSIHNDLKKQHETTIAQAAQRQQRIDFLNQRLDAMDRHLQFIDETLPEHDKELARRIFAQVQLQVQQAQQVQPVMYENAEPAMAMRKMKKLEIPAVAADAPSISKEKPE